MNGFAFARFISIAEQWSDACAGYVDTAMPWADLVKAMDAAGFALDLNIHRDVGVWKITTGHGEAAVKVDDYGDVFALNAAGVTAEGARAALDACTALIPERTYGDENTVDVSFWSYDPMYGGTRYVRGLPRLAWSDVRPNYPASVRTKLDELTALRDAPNNGRLFVFHGPAGTGKSRLLQTLASEWSSFADVHYIVDADRFFGSADYMIKVMMGGRDSDRWRLVVAEDSDEFIDAHAKAKTGQGSARLLNIADGLVGQGLKVMVLASTNVHAARFSKAVVRPGRCAALVEFPAFPVSEAQEWCAANGIEGAEFETPVTLAELYALKTGAVE